MEGEIEAFLTELRTKRSASKGTLLAYASDLHAFLAFLGNTVNQPVRINDLEPQKISAFLEAEINASYKRSTLTRRLATLRRFFSFLESQGLLNDHRLTDSAATYQEIINRARSGQHLLCLSSDQIASLLDAMSRNPRPRAVRDQAILMLLLETGLSVRQLTALDLDDLDLPAGQVNILFTENLRQWLPLGEAQAYLERYLQKGRPDLIQDSHETALFVSQKDGRLSRQGIWQILHLWGGKVDPPITLSPRLVRYTAVQRMLRRGRSVAEIQRLLGHNNQLSTLALLRRLSSIIDMPGSISSFESVQRSG